MTADPEAPQPPARVRQHSPKERARAVRQALVVVGLVLVGVVMGWGASVIQNQSNQLDRRSAVVTYLTDDSAWARCLLRQDVLYKQAFLGAVIALTNENEDEYDAELVRAGAALERYENIDTVCPPPTPPEDPG